MSKPQEPSLANAHVVQAEPQSYGADDAGTTERLFPDDIQPAEIAEEPAAEQETQEEETQDETPAEEPSSEEPAAAEPPPEPEPTFDLEKFKDKKVKVKVDGQESEVPLAELIKSYQTDQHLGRKGNQVGEQRRLLAEEMRKLDDLRRQVNATGQQQDPQRAGDPRDAELSELRTMVQQLAQGVQPTLYESARQRLASELKAEGFDDFISFIPKLDAYVATVEDENLFNYYNTPQGAKALFYQMKAQELKSAPPPPAPPKVPPVRPKAPIVKIEGGANGSQGIVDDTVAKIRAAMEHARANPKDREAWNEVLRLKGLL